MKKSRNYQFSKIPRKSGIQKHVWILKRTAETVCIEKEKV